jgi:hypothetical protein
MITEASNDIDGDLGFLNETAQSAELVDKDIG